jgi:hypothetical protein
MTALLGGEVNTWLVIMLLVLSLGLAGALLVATRETQPRVRRTR